MELRLPSEMSRATGSPHMHLFGHVTRGFNIVRIHYDFANQVKVPEPERMVPFCEVCGSHRQNPTWKCQSCCRCISSCRDSEAVGVGTAEPRLGESVSEVHAASAVFLLLHGDTDGLCSPQFTPKSKMRNLLTHVAARRDMETCARVKSDPANAPSRETPRSSSVSRRRRQSPAAQCSRVPLCRATCRLLSDAVLACPPMDTSPPPGWTATPL